MDRLNRTLAGCGLALVLAAGGCRSTRPEVPPGPRFTGDGKQVPPLNFSTEPHPMTGPGVVPNAGMPGLPGVPGGAQLGTPGPASSNYGAPTGNQYGPPGTALGLGAEPGAMPSAGLGAPSAGSAPDAAFPPYAP